MTVDKEAISEEIKKQIEDAASKEEIYEPKYGGKDHSGYETMMKYEVNDERYECFEKGAYFGYNLAAASLIKERDELKISLEMTQLGWNGTIDKKEEWENQAKALSAVKKGIEFMIDQQNTTINELTASNEAKEKEIERLKGLVYEISKGNINPDTGKEYFSGLDPDKFNKKF